MRISVGTKLIGTYLAVIALTIAPAAGIWYYLNQVRRSQQHVLFVAQPTVAAAKSVREGLHESAAGLRGYIAIGGEHFRAQRQAGHERARRGLGELSTLALHGTAEERQLLDQLRRELGDIEAIHRAMETAPRAADEVPAFQKLAGDTAPLGQRMLGAVSAMIDIESKLEKTPQRARLLDELTALRAALHGSLMEMHSYLTTAQEQHVKNFADQWQGLRTALAGLTARQWMFTADQDRQFGDAQRLIGQFQPLPDRLFAMRKSQSWNVAQQRVKDEAGPREAQAQALLAQLIKSSEGRAHKAQQALHAQSAWLGALAVGGPGAAAILGIFVGFAATRRLARRVEKATRALEAVAAGDMSTRLPAETSDEFGRMALAINALAEAQAGLSRPAAERQAAGDMNPGDMNTERLRTFLGAEIGRRRPLTRPQTAATHTSRATESLATSSDRLRTQATQLDQLMRQIQEGLARINAGEPETAEAAGTTRSDIHGAETTLAGPKALAVQQPVMQNT
jgi:methyl-accepting chemotaxis protein